MGIKEMEQNDQILIDRFCNGDRAAFYELVGRYKKRIFYLAYDITGDHQDANDISQEVFIKMFRFLKNFRRDAKVSSWLHTVVVNTSIDSLRKKSAVPSDSLSEKSPSIIQEDPLTRPSLSFNPEHNAEVSQIQEHISLALQKISPKERSVFVMRHYNNLRLKEIAEIMNIKTGTVKSLLFRAVKKLRKELSPQIDNQLLEATHE